MAAKAVLIVEPKVDFTTFLSACNAVLGFTPSTKIDQDRLEHSDTERFLASLAALRDPNAVGVPPNLLTFASYSILVIADERDLTDVLECASGMSFVTADTVKRGVVMGVIHGTLAQWRDAVKTGASRTTEPSVRSLYCQVMSLFDRAGCAWVWKDFQAKPLDDQTFYLEDKRK